MSITNQGMEHESIVKQLAKSRLPRNLAVVAVGGLLLSGCSLSKYSSPQTHYLYDAPAQAYSIDLGAQNFRGGVRLRDSCTPEGSSLNIYDNAGRFFRIDAVNLINNPNIVLPEFADDITTRDVVLRYYNEKVNPGGRVLLQRNVNSRMGSSSYAVVQHEIAVKDIDKDLNTTRYMGYLVTRRGNYAYVIQHEQKFYRSDRMLEILGLLASEIQIPGRLPTNKKQSDLPLYIDLKNATPLQIEEWKKAAQCGESHIPTSKWLGFGPESKTDSTEPAVDYANPDHADPVSTVNPDGAPAEIPKKPWYRRVADKLTFWK
jgi:hypothetical protein